MKKEYKKPVLLTPHDKLRPFVPALAAFGVGMASGLGMAVAGRRGHVDIEEKEDKHLEPVVA